MQYERKVKIELWKDIPGYEGYYVASNLGRIKALQREICQNKNSTIYKRIMREQIIKPRKINSGYLIARLSKNGKCKAYTVHSLVYAAFNGKYPTKFQINHKDGNKENNSLYNLELVTRSENIKHSYKFLNHKKKSQKVLCVNTKEVFNSIIEAANAMNINRGCISHVINKRNKTVGGFEWIKV